MAYKAWLCVAVSCTCAASVLAVTPVYDETLWTKQLWVQRWKLDKEAFVTNPSDDNPTLYPAYPDARGSLLNSLEGPGPRIKPTAAKVDSVDAAALDDESLLQPAAQAVRCTVCHTLVTKVWQRVVVDLLKGVVSMPTAPAFLPLYLNQACDQDVVGLLQRTVIYRMEVENDAHAITFFVLRKRKPGTVPTMSERQAVQLACQEVLNSAQSELVSLLDRQLNTFSHDLKGLLVKHGLQGIPHGSNADSAGQAEGTAATSGGGDTDMPATGRQTTATAAAGGAEATAADGAGAGTGTGSGAGGRVAAAGDDVPPLLDGLVDKLLKGLAAQLKREGILLQQSGDASHDDDDEYADPDDVDDDGIECMDMHPLCERWANDGECEANPNYMVGTNKLKGHCRKACGLCAPTSQTPQDVLKSHPQFAKDVQTLSNQMMQAVKAEGCGASQACLTSTSGVGLEGTVLTARIDAGKLRQAPNPQGGFVLGRPSWGVPELEETRASRAVAEKQQAALRDAGARDSEADSSHKSQPAGGGRTQLQLDVDAVLSKELGGRLLRLRTEYFTYEYLYKNHTRHFHEDEKQPGHLIEDWLMGVYERESVVVEASAAAGGGVAVLQPKDVLPVDAGVRMADQSWPYVKQVYSGGDVCTLGGGRRAIRRTEVRIACSPDSLIRFLVREPEFCHYIFVIYSPALCALPQFRPFQRSVSVTDAN